MATDSRWRQRFENFEKAFLFFQKVITEKNSYSELEIAGLVQAFEFTFELGWKTIKDYLYEKGLPTTFPRDAIKEGFRTAIIEDGHTRIEMLEKRNELSYTFNEEVAISALKVIKGNYYQAIEQVYNYLKTQANE